MVDDVTVLRLVDRERWEAAHRDAGWPSQSWHYAHGLQAAGIEPQLAVVRSGGARMLLPFIERGFRDATDIATIPSLSGASIAPVSWAPLALWRDYAAGRGWVAGYVQLASDVDLAPQPATGTIVAHNAVFVLDLRPAELLAIVSTNVRRKIRAAEQEGVTLVEDRAAIAGRLVDLHPEAMSRLAGTDRYPAETFRRWAQDPACIAVAAAIDGTIEAAHLYWIAGRRAEGVLAATSERGRTLGTWVIWQAMRRLRDLGVETLNIGGGGRVGDGLYRYKERFNVAPTPLRSLRQIYDRARYDALCREAGVLADGGWFPAYRSRPRPAVSGEEQQ